MAPTSHWMKLVAGPAFFGVFDPNVGGSTAVADGTSWRTTLPPLSYALLQSSVNGIVFSKTRQWTLWHGISCSDPVNQDVLKPYHPLNS